MKELSKHFSAFIFSLALLAGLATWYFTASHLVMLGTLVWHGAWTAIAMSWVMLCVAVHRHRINEARP